MTDRPIIPIPGLPTPATAAVSGKVSRKNLRVEANVRLKDSPEADLPVEGPDFKDERNPLRIEIETLLLRIAPGDKKVKADVEKRNADRIRVVEEYLQENYPDNPTLRRLVMDDLVSYQAWEMPEEDDA